MKYWEEQNFEPKEQEQLSNNVVNILNLFRLLSVQDKLKVRNLIREESII